MLTRFLALLACCSLSCAVLAQQPAHLDTSVQGRLQTAAQLKEMAIFMDEDMNRQLAAVEAAVHEAKARAKGREQEVVRVFRAALGSRTNQEFDRRIAALTGELRGMFRALNRGEIKGAQADARFMACTQELLLQLRSVCERQTAYLVQQLRVQQLHAVKPVPRP